MNDEYVYLWSQWGALDSGLHAAAILRFGSLERAWREVRPDFFLQERVARAKVERLFEIREMISLHDVILTLRAHGARILYVGDDDYPFYLRHLSTPPPFLFVRGELPSFERSLGVVGTRHVTDYGLRITRKLTAELVESGFVIVSGLAMGVDTCAHETALAGGGVTVGVLGCGVDRIYPASNNRLAGDMLSRSGAVVSTYPLGTPPMRHHFPERNLIIAGLSRGVLVTEGGVRSGALITARQALDEGREVFAVPNNIGKSSLSGTNHLIRRGEAKLVEDSEHILEEFGLRKANRQAHGLSAEEGALVQLLSRGGCDLDQLADGTGWSVSRLSTLLMGLSMRGVIVEEGSAWLLA